MPARFGAQMKIEYVAKEFSLDEHIRDFVSDQLERISTFLQDPLSAHVTLAVEGRRHRADVHVSHRHGSLQATEETGDMQSAIHLAADKLEKQARRARKKLQTNRRRAARQGGPEFWSHGVVPEDSVGQESGPHIVESKRVQVKPMTIDEAVLSLQSSETSEFVVFRAAEDQSISVVYRRKDGNYGLISPEA